MISLLLFKQIFKMFLCIILGWILVKAGKLRPEDSRPLSIVCLYLIMPCVLINAFQIEKTARLLQGLKMALALAVGIHIFLLLITGILRKPLNLSVVERASVIYSNAGNLIIPIISALIGKEWVIFTSIYMIVQQSLLWTHLRMILTGEKKISLRNIFYNCNVISIIVGACLFFAGISLPTIIVETMDSIGVLIGPISMFIAGMLLGGIDIPAVIRKLNLWKVVILRLIVTPLIIVLIIKLLGVQNMVQDGDKIVLISLLAACAPSASMVTQLAQVYDNDAEYAGAINAMTSLLCVLTMPVIIAVYQF